MTLLEYGISRSIRLGREEKTRSTEETADWTCEFILLLDSSWSPKVHDITTKTSWSGYNVVRMKWCVHVGHKLLHVYVKCHWTKLRLNTRECSDQLAQSNSLISSASAFWSKPSLPHEVSVHWPFDYVLSLHRLRKRSRLIFCKTISWTVAFQFAFLWTRLSLNRETFKKERICFTGANHFLLE